MSIFRLQEHVPDVYPRKSRDFQLMCNLYDCVNNGVKYDIDSIVNIVDTKTCSSSIIPLLQTKLGFFCDKEYNTEQLRVVLSGFQHVLKHKGSRRGVLEAIQLFLKAQGVSRGSKVSVTNSSTNKGATSVSGEYIVDVGIESEMLDTSLLTDILRYILPAGYKLEYSFYTGFEQSSEIEYEDKVTVVLVSKGVNDGIRSSDYFNHDACSKGYQHEDGLYKCSDGYFVYDDKDSYDFRKSGLNYILVEAKPSDWGTDTARYFEYKSNEYELVTKIGRNPLPDPSKELYYYKCTNPEESDEFKRTYEEVTDTGEDYDTLELWELKFEKALVAPAWEKFKTDHALDDTTRWCAHKSNYYLPVTTEPDNWGGTYTDYFVVEYNGVRYTLTTVEGVKPAWEKNKYYNGSHTLITSNDVFKLCNPVYIRTVTKVESEERFPDFKADTFYTAEIDYGNVNAVGTSHTVSRLLHSVTGNTLEVTKYTADNDTEV